MTAQKRTILLCDHEEHHRQCRSRFLGNLLEATASVRKRAKAAGWVSWTTSSDMFTIRVDRCPRHAHT